MARGSTRNRWEANRNLGHEFGGAIEDRAASRKLLSRSSDRSCDGTSELVPQIPIRLPSIPGLSLEPINRTLEVSVS